MSQVPEVKKIVLGITGGIATGKSTVLHLLAKAGYATLSADDLAHAAIHNGKPAYRRIVKRYGRNILNTKGEINRVLLGGIVFGSPTERRWLERVIHPVVIRGLRAFTRHSHKSVALDIPLLYEARLQKLVDHVWVVSCTPSQQLRRLRERSGLPLIDLKRRIKAQMPLAEKVRRADTVIRNTGAKSQLKTRVQQALKYLCPANRA